MNESRFVGSIVGLAVGDALGYPAEFRSRAQILREIGPEGITDFLPLQDTRFTRPIFLGPANPPGTFTDDTQMSIAVAEALLESGRTTLDGLMQSMGARFVEWSTSATNNRAPGTTCMMGCENLARGVPWRDAGVANSKGCGSAMRVAAIGLYYEDLDQVADVARASSLLTHGHPVAVEAAAAGALMVALALRDFEPSAMLDEIRRRCGSAAPEFRQLLDRLPQLVTLPPHQALAKDGIGEAWVADEAVVSALYCYWRHPDSFSQAVLTAVNTDGDSDSIATITGSILGARWGVDAIPVEWRQCVEDSSQLHELGRRLWHTVRAGA